ncbi:hypothetical protein HF086_017740 [Spodoptera exigua]|uniref:Uncharacterized protein n=1 Tax=Spodoptera exigua TaxID=7107 RepID=A0A922SD19_SPOEX|nr:hypothetical protein HF086_017740 [Spodoptera exigua]
MVIISVPISFQHLGAVSTVIAAAESARDGGELAILVRGPSGSAARREELLHAKGAEDVAISLFYNGKTNKVSLESLHGGHIKSVSWGLGDSPRGTLALVITPSRVKLIVGCKPLHWHSMSGRHDLLATLSSQKMKLYHEENAPVEVYSSERAVLDSLNCNHHADTMKPPALTTVEETDFEEVRDFLAKDARRKREEEMQGDEYRGNYIDPNVLPQPPPQPNRGDIPSNAIESYEVIRQLTLLRQTIDHLRREIGEQKGTIDSLRSQLRQCCNRVVPTPPPVERCSGSSCYPGY